jgi:hypothetical protein
LSGGPCKVCGQRAGTLPERDHALEQARRLVRLLVTSNGIALATPGAEEGVVTQTAFLLSEAESRSDERMAAVLEEAWMARDDVAEIFLDVHGIAAAIQKTAG